MPESLGLNHNSSMAMVHQKISMCIRIMRKHGKEPKQAAAICYSMARKESGKELKE